MNEVGLRTPSFTVMVKDALLLFIRDRGFVVNVNLKSVLPEWTVRRPCCVPAVSCHYHSHSRDCAQTMLCTSWVVSLLFILTGLCADHVVHQLGCITTIHTHRTVRRPCCVPAGLYHYHSYSRDCAQTMLCTSWVVSLPLTLTGLCADHVVCQLCRVTTIHTHRTVRIPCCAPAGLYHYYSYSRDCAQTMLCASCVMPLPFTLTGLCTDHVVRQLCRITTIHAHRTVRRLFYVATMM
uniref:Uncharacterized protein n=1 Tax=Timema douglasi TaxID=61478 RepID=A0A7R8VEF2_TIMDO|nr:unnamed protein product [Timema douglasi]